MNASSDPQLDELFVRYWDDTLTADEADELARLLAADPVAREWFQLLSLQAVSAAELPAFSPPVLALPRLEPAPASPAPKEARRWSRRRVLAALGGGLAAGVGGVALGRWLWGDAPDNRVRLSAVQGTVRLRAADGQVLPARGFVPAGATVSTEGIGAAALLTYPDGSTVALIGDSALTVAEGGRELRLRQGTASADLRSRPDEGDRLTLATDHVALSGVSRAMLLLGQGVRATEVEVQQGAVAVSDLAGEPLAVVRAGELLTVGPNGDRHQRRTPTTPDEFAWNLNAPLPEGWQVGRREVGPDGPIVRPVAWPDPYYDGTVMHQIRSDKQWTRGFFRLVEDSVVHVRYRAARPSPRGQFCFCVRTPQARCSDTGMLEYNGGFEATRADEWRWVRVRAADLRHNKHAPQFGVPWIGFLVIFNTYEEDVGLQVAEFRVTPPA